MIHSSQLAQLLEKIMHNLKMIVLKMESCVGQRSWQSSSFESRENTVIVIDLVVVSVEASS